MLLGFVQTAPVFGDKPSNRAQIESLIGSARADLWVMPELALTGYEFLNRDEAREFAEEIPSGETCRWLVEFCGEHGCHAVIGLAERDGVRVFNSAILAGPKGIVGSYRKLQLFNREQERFDPGDRSLQVYDISLARVGLMICFDWRFPEVARTLSLLGAQILAHPSNLVQPYCQRAMITRALENRVFCVTANRIGIESRVGESVGFTGESQMVSPAGVVLKSTPRDRTACEVVEMDPAEADDKRVTPFNDVLADRRPEFYRLTR